MTDRTRASWLVYVLGALCTGAIVAAFLLVGPASQSATARERVITVQQGVVQSTVSGSGNIQAASQLDLGFKTSGEVTHIYVTQGAQVAPGQLLATLNPESAEVTLEQTKASLQAAEATLAQEEENGGETAAGQSGGGSSATGRTTASTALAGTTTPAPTPTPISTALAGTTTPAPTPTPIKTTPSKTIPTKTTPSKTAPSRTTSTTTTPSTSEKTKQSSATREANLASARAAVKSDKLAVQSDEQAVADTKLYAPTSGTIVSLSGEVGESVSGTGTTKATSSSGGSSSGSGSGSSGASAGARSGAAASSSGGSSGSSGSSSSGSASSSFAVLSDLNSMQLVVPLSESEIIHVHVGQPATVTVEALEGLKLAAHVVSVATLSTSNSGVVSYDVTFQLDQMASGLKPGMSASGEVVVKQAEGVNVPTTAISGGAVTVVRGGKQVRQAVVTGLAGNSSTIILSGLEAGEEIALPVASTSSATSITSRLGGRAGGTLGGGLGGGGFAGGGGGGGGGVFFRGGG
jgi:multidrug efflux pump subunit AcrA (membrane-fusion protein)